MCRARQLVRARRSKSASKASSPERIPVPPASFRPRRVLLPPGRYFVSCRDARRQSVDLWLRSLSFPLSSLISASWFVYIMGQCSCPVGAGTGPRPGAPGSGRRPHPGRPTSRRCVAPGRSRAPSGSPVNCGVELTGEFCIQTERPAQNLAVHLCVCLQTVGF